MLDAAGISGLTLLSLDDVAVFDEAPETGATFEANALAKARDAETEIAAADWPAIRFLDVPNQTADSPRTDFESAGWQPCKPDNIGQFSAVAYFFGRELHEELHVAIGLIGCNWGGTRMEAWTSREALAASPTFAASEAASPARILRYASAAAAGSRPSSPSAEPSALSRWISGAKQP